MSTHRKLSQETLFYSLSFASKKKPLTSLPVQTLQCENLAFDEKAVMQGFSSKSKLTRSKTWKRTNGFN